MSSYPRLRRAMDAIPLIDAHSHVLHHDIIPQTPDGPYDVLPLARLLLDFNTRPVFLSAGFPAEAVDRILKGHVSPDTQKQLLLSCRGIWSVQELRFLLRGFVVICIFVHAQKRVAEFRHCHMPAILSREMSMISSPDSSSVSSCACTTRYRCAESPSVQTSSAHTISSSAGREVGRSLSRTLLGILGLKKK